MTTNESIKSKEQDLDFEKTFGRLNLRLSTRDKKEIRGLLEKGYSIFEISKITGWSTQTIWKVKGKTGFKKMKRKQVTISIPEVLYTHIQDMIDVSTEKLNMSGVIMNFVNYAIKNSPKGMFLEEFYEKYDGDFKTSYIKGENEDED